MEQTARGPSRSGRSRAAAWFTLRVRYSSDGTILLCFPRGRWCLPLGVSFSGSCKDRRLRKVAPNRVEMVLIMWLQHLSYRYSNREPPPELINELLAAAVSHNLIDPASVTCYKFPFCSATPRAETCSPALFSRTLRANSDAAKLQHSFRSLGGSVFGIRRQYSQLDWACPRLLERLAGRSEVRELALSRFNS